MSTARLDVGPIFTKTGQKGVWRSDQGGSLPPFRYVLIDVLAATGGMALVDWAPGNDQSASTADLEVATWKRRIPEGHARLIDLGSVGDGWQLTVRDADGNYVAFTLAVDSEPIYESAFEGASATARGSNGDEVALVTTVDQMAGGNWFISPTFSDGTYPFVVKPLAGSSWSVVAGATLPVSGDASWLTDNPVPVAGQANNGSFSTHGLAIQGTNPGGAVPVAVTGPSNGLLPVGQYQTNAGGLLNGTKGAGGDSVVGTLTITGTGSVRYLRSYFLEIAVGTTAVNSGHTMYLKGQTSLAVLNLIQLVTDSANQVVTRAPAFPLAPLDLLSVFPTDSHIDVHVNNASGTFAAWDVYATAS